MSKIDFLPQGIILMLPHEIIQEIAAAADIVTYIKIKQVSSWLNTWINASSRKVIHLEINKETNQVTAIINNRRYNLINNAYIDYTRTRITIADNITKILGYRFRAAWIQVKDYPRKEIVFYRDGGKVRETRYYRLLHFVNEIYLN